MRKPTNLRLILLTLFLLQSYLMLGQNHVPFTSRFDTSIRGDMMLIGNSIVNRDNNKKTEYANDAFTGGTDNNNENMQYIDIDNDPDTFSSSSATLKVPDASRACYNIVYAGLYWSGVYTQASLDNKTVKRSDLGNIKFMLANETAYNNITGSLIYDYYNNNPKTTNGDQIPYAYYANVTQLLKDSKNPEGEYTVANVNSARGKLGNGGYAAGWSLFVIYEDPNSSAKYITAYDGFSWIKAGGADLTYRISGFKTIPTGNVKVKLAFAALEGDKGTSGDTYSVNGTQVFTTERTKNNFFCSVINDLSGHNLARRPASTNTLGFDAGIIELNNASNAIIKNNDTRADLKLTTSGDGYGVYFNAFNVEVIAPQIALTKIVKDTDGKDIGGKNVTLGQELRYEISIQNKGNDDATSLIITDQLPINVIFNQKDDLLPLPKGIIVKTPYDPVTRKIVFEVTDPELIKKNSPTVSTIAFKVQVVPDCRSLSEACSNSIDNQAFATYKGKENTNFSIDERDPQGSVNSTEGCAVTPKATNFLVGVTGCEYTENVTLCTESVDLIPAKGYDKYTWYSDAEMKNKIGEGNPFNVTKEGTYYVYNLAEAPCRSISQSFVVTRFKSTSTNPVLPFASEVLTCADTGQPFPNIYLCGGNDKKEIKTNITDASNIVWERFVEGSCTVSTGQNCPNESLTSTGNPSEVCKWDQVGIGSDYTANAKGRYRLTVTYKGGVCFNRFYFDVYQNPLTPKEKHTDIICSTNGSITIEDVPAGYEYAISKDPNGPIGAYQSSNIFPISTPGSYTVHIKQTAVTTFPCDFTVEKILIRNLDVDVKTVITQPLCAGNKGSVEVAANNVNPNYTFVIKQGTTTVQTVGPASPNNAKFDLLPGNYDLIVTTSDGCTHTSEVKIVAPDALSATYDIKPLTACSDGEITVNPKGGTGPYYYSINAEPFVAENKIPVINPGGSYSIIVVDSHDCAYTIPTFSVNPIAKPTVTINSKNLSCYNAKEGEISISVSPADSGYTVSYSVNGGTYTSLPTTGLTKGDYKVIVKYTIGGVECTDPEKTITINGPASELTASGGVAELSGCGPTGHEDQGLVRITNAQGGVPFPAPDLYRYSFDNGDTWITSNQAYVEPRATPYTLLIKDAAGCIFEVKGIVLDPKPAKPTFDVSDAVYNCNGQGTVTVTANVSTSASYTYSYYIGKPDPANPGSYIYTLNTNTPANVYKDLPAGDYKIKVEYTLVQVPTFSNLLKEDFGNGADTTSPGINSVYCFERQDAIVDCNKFNVWHPWLMNDGEYTVTKGILPDHDPDFGWVIPTDHTKAPGIPDGRYLAINIGGEAEGIPVGTIIYSKPIHDVIPKQDVKVTFYALNLLKSTNLKAAPDLTIELSKNGVAVPGASIKTAKITQNEQWNKIELAINPGDNTDLDFVIKTNIAIVDGSDLAVDDILVYQLPKSCLSAEVLDLKVENGKGFKAEVKDINGVSCSDSADGRFSIYVENFDTTNGFYYTLNGGATSPTWVQSTVSPVHITGRTSGTYDVRVRYANDAASCNFTIPTLVPSKDPFIVNATASAATCKGATVTATAIGGTPGYTITIKDKNSPYTKTFPSDGILNEVPAGTYIISGVDSKSCTDDMDTELVIDPASIPQAEVVQNTGLCFDNNTGAKITVNIIGGVGPFRYKVSTDGGTNYGSVSAAFNETSFDYDVNAPGTYTFLITDGNSCDAVAVSQTINEQISARSSISGALTCTTGNATIEVKIDGGTAPYKYEVKNKTTNAVLFTSGDITGPTFTYTNVPGTYVFTITDKNGCKAVEEIEVKQTEPVTAEHKVENVTCYDAKNGYVDITPLTGVAPFRYQFNGTGTFGPDTHYGNLEGSVAGIEYSYIIKDDLGCEQTYKFKVYQPEDLNPSASITIPYTCETSATISASAIGGNAGGYTFVLKNTTTNTTVGSNTTGLFENLTTPGSYSVTVTDSKNCSKTVVAGTINAVNPPKGMTINNSAVTCPSNKATVTITDVVNASNVAVPTTGLEYRIKAPAAYATTTFQSSNSFPGLDAGVTYTFEVRDANKCLYEKVYEIKALPVFTVSVKSKNDISCLNATDGSAVFTVSGLGNVVRYSYQVDALAAVTGLQSPASGTSFDISVSVPGLSAGDHKIRVTNTDTTCFVEQTVTIAAPAAQLALDPETLTHVTCKDKGTATINVVGGWGNNTYVVTPPTGPAISQTTNLFTNLGAGNYTYTVTDLRGCSVDGSFTINDKVDPTASIDVAATDLCAGGAGATITVTPSNNPNYVYSINKGGQKTTGIFTGLIPDEYIVTVTDITTGCSIDLPKQVVAVPVVVTDHKITKKLDCNTSTDAIIEVTIGKGYPDYRYRVNVNGAGFPATYTDLGAGVTTFTYPAAVAGSYVFEILDSKGCKTGFTENIATKVTPDFTTDITVVKCFGASTGKIIVTATPTSGTYEYSKDNGLNWQASNEFAGLEAASYDIVVRDTNTKCFVAKPVTVTGPAAIFEADAKVTTDLKCATNNASQAAVITVTASGGTPYTGTNKYRYTYDTGNPATSISLSNSNTFTINADGTVNITVTDANGCTVATSATVVPLTPPTVIAFSSPAITCEVSKLTTDLKVDVTGGKLPLKYEITSYTAATAPTGGLVATNINANTYTFTGLVSGTYNFTITDDNGCTKTGTAVIDPVTPILESGKIDTNVSCRDLSDGRLVFTISGNTNGTNGYDYSLTGSTGVITTGISKTGDVITYSGLKADSYTFSVTNNLTKCEAHETIVLTNPTAVTIVSATGPKVFCDRNDTTITVTANGGTGTLYYAVVKAGSTEPTYPADYTTIKTFSKNTLVDGEDYDVYVRDSKGCPAQTTAHITRDAVPTVDPIGVTCFAGSPITISMSGTVFPGSGILYGIDGNYSTNPVKTITDSGTYELTVKDDNGCISAVFDLNISDKLLLTVKPDKNITCTPVAPFTTAQAQVTLSASGGDNSYVYGYSTSISGPFTTMPGNVFNTSTQGTYYFNVTSAGCSQSSTVGVELTDPVKPTADADVTDLNCFQSADGVVTIVPKTGVGPFKYSFNGGTPTDNPTFTNLAASTGLGYPYTITDAKGCISDVAYAVVTEPAEIQFTYSTVDMLCPGPSLGSVTVSAVTNGDGPYTYELRNIVTGTKIVDNQDGITPYTFEDLSYGDFILTVYDSKGCPSVKKDVKIIAPPSNLNIDLTIPIATCAAGATIIVDLNPAVYPVNPDYRFGIADTEGIPFASVLLPADPGFPLRHTFNGLTPGVIYTFVIYDPITNCYYFKKADGAVAPITTLASVATAIPVACKSTPTGGVSISLSGTSASQVKYEIFYDNSDKSAGISGTITMPTTVPVEVRGLKPGTYYVKFTELDGSATDCTSASAPFVVTESSVDLSVTANSPKKDNCKNDAGQVVATPRGGTGPFKYIINQSATPPLVTDAWGADNDNIFNVESGSYYVWVKDAYDCIKSTTVDVDLDPSPEIDKLEIVDKCAVDGKFEVTVSMTTQGIAPYYISVNGGDWTEIKDAVPFPYTIKDLSFGPVIVKVKDFNDCEDSDNITITETPKASAQVTKPLDCSVSGNAVANATITVKVEKGTLPYFSYEVKKGASGSYVAFTPTTTTVVAGVTTFTYTVAAADADVYKFRITDANGCPIETSEVTVEEIVPIDPDYTPIQPLCNGGNGTIEVSAKGGKGPYTYNFNNLGFSKTTLYTVAAGTYPFIVRDALGCEVTSSATLGEPTLLELLTPEITGLTCGTGNVAQSAKVVLKATGGTGDYTYSFDGGDFIDKDTYTVNENSTKTDQHILYAIKDENDCVVHGFVDILRLVPPSDFVLTPGLAITCSRGTTTATISGVVGGVGTLTYQIISPASAVRDNGTVTTFTNLLPDVEYVFQVTDENKCTFQKRLKIDNVIKIDIKELSTDGITCATATDGKASFFVSGFGSNSGTYQYTVDAPGTAVTGLTNPVINLTGLSAGHHTITVYDDETECSLVLGFDIAAPPAALVLATPVVTPLGCTTRGKVILTASGGWGDYTFTLTQPDKTQISNTNGVFENLTQSGLYDVEVKDANNCTDKVTDSFELLVAPQPTLTIATTSDYCYYNTDSTTLVITAASTSTFPVTYEYSIDNGETWHSTYTFDKLTPKTYLIKVRDNYGCESAATSTEIKPQLFASAKKREDIFCTNVDGTIRVSAIGGYPDYSYTVAINGALASGKIPFGPGATFVDYTVNAATPGTYVFTVYDQHDCEYLIEPIEMTAPTPVVYTPKPTSPYCAGGQGNMANGTILLELAAGNNDNDYKYSIQLTSAPGGLLITQDTPLFTGLTAGTYAVNVTSGRNCDAPTTVVINNPSLVEATATPSAFTCSGTNTANSTIVEITATGGAGSGAIGDYLYSENGTNWKADNKFIVDNEVAQTLTFYAKDANGCIDDVTIPLAAFPKLTAATATLFERASCDNNGHETIKVAISGGSSPANFDYEVYQDGLLLQTATPVGAGNTSFDYIAPAAGHFYQFKIIDNVTFCSVMTDAYNVPLYETAKVVAKASTAVSCNGGTNGEITIDVIDYTGTYTYQVFNGGVAVTGVLGPIDSATTNPFTIPVGVGAGSTYTVVIKENDYPFCSVTSNTFEITQPPVLDLISFKPTVKNQNCRSTGAVITIDETQIVGGTKGYKYVVVSPTAGIPADASFKDEKIITIPTAAIAPAFDTWHVYVMDAKGCKAFVPVNISLDPMPAITNVTVDSPCYDVNGYKINVVATGVAKLQYSLDGKQYQDDASFIVKNAGDYTVWVRDANQCVVQTTTAFNIPAPLTLKAEITTDPTCMTATGVVTLTAGGGKMPANYVYTKDNWNTTSVDNIFRDLAPGNYTFIVRDISTTPTCEKSVDVKIEIPTLITGITATGYAVTCNTYRDGRIEVKLDAANNNPEYRYSLTSGPETRAIQDSPYFYDLPAGDYVVTVISGKGCPGTADVTVGEPAPIVVDEPIVTQYLCNVGNTAIDATITVPAGSVRGGSNDYIRYQFVRDGKVVQDDNRNTYTESDYLGGRYDVYVFDSKGCQGGYSSVTIAQYVDIASLDLATTKINCRDAESVQVTAIPTRGTLPTLTYTIEGTNSTVYPVTNGVNGLFTGLRPGTYLIKVTNPVTGCGVEKPYIVNEPNTFRFVASDVKNVTCFTDTDGSITLTLVDDIPTPTDESGPFTYVLTRGSDAPISGSSNSTTLVLPNLAAGKYTITATLDGVPYCPVTTSFTIEGPAAALEILPSKKDITCVTGNDDGEIRVSAQGGWSGDYLYKLDGPVTVDFSTQNIFPGLKAGLYTVSVKDAGGCVDTDQILLEDPKPIVVTASSNITLLLCNGDMSATITATSVTGGQGSNYLYTLNTTSSTPVRSSGPQLSPSFAGLGVGTYTVTVTDGFNCIGESAPITITEPSKVQPSLAETRQRTCLTDTQLTLSVIGGTPPYTYSTDGVNYSTVPFPSSVQFEVIPGKYKYYVKDANGCISFDTNEITIPALEPLLANVDTTHAVVLCREDASGVIVANATGGLGNYEYTLLDKDGNVLKGPQSEGRFDKLLAGDYKVVVKSGDCQTPPEDVNISQPQEVFSAEFIPTAVKCFGGNDGQIEVIGKGGTGRYTYSISPRNDQFFDTNIFTKLKAGFYTVIATDENGCYDPEVVEVKQPLAPLSVVETPGKTEGEQCAGERNGTFTIDIAGGTAPYMVSLNDINGTYQPVNGTQHTFENLAGGIYTVFVKDGGNCPQEVEVSVPLPVTLNPKVKVTYDCVNNAQSNMVIVSIDKSNTDPTQISYALDNGTFQPNNIFTDVSGGEPHYVTVRHTNGCEVSTDLFDVDAVDPVSLIDTTKQSNEINTISVKASGGIAPYEYSFNGEPFSSSNTYRIYKTDVYKVIVRDKNGCEATIDVPGTFYDFCLPNYFTPNGSGANTTIGPDCGALAYKDLTFDVYDRYGRVVGKYKVGGKWDGRYNGNELPTGDYWYVLKLNDPKDPREFVGHFTLYR